MLVGFAADGEVAAAAVTNRELRWSLRDLEVGIEGLALEEASLREEREAELGFREGEERLKVGGVTVEIAAIVLGELRVREIKNGVRFIY